MRVNAYLIALLVGWESWQLNGANEFGLLAVNKWFLGLQLTQGGGARQLLLEVGNNLSGGRSKRLTMPVLLVRDVGEVESLEGLHDESHRLALDGAGSGEGLHELLNIVAVDDDGMPTEGLSALLVGVKIVLQAGGLALAKTVDVKDGNQVVELVVRREGHGFPDATLRRLTVTNDAIHTVAGLVNVLSSVGHTGSVAQALTQGTGGNIDEAQTLNMVKNQLSRELKKQGDYIAQNLQGLGDPQDRSRFCAGSEVPSPKGDQLQPKRRRGRGQHDPLRG